MSTLPLGPSFKVERSQWSATTVHQTKICNYTLFLRSTTLYSSLVISMATLQAGDMLISKAEESKEKIGWFEESLILINRPDDQSTHLSHAWKTSSTPDLAIASKNIQNICDREVYTQLGGSDHLPVLLKVTLTEQTTSQKKEPSWN